MLPKFGAIPLLFILLITLLKFFDNPAVDSAKSSSSLESTSSTLTWKAIPFSFLPFYFLF